MKVPDGRDYVEFMLFKETPPPNKRGTPHHLALELADATASVASLKQPPYAAQYDRPIEFGSERTESVK